MRNIKLIFRTIFIATTFLLASGPADAQTTAFNYQGRLTDGGNAANGSFQMRFQLFDAPAGGAQIGTTLTDVSVTATNGVFGVKLDFGANALNGENRFLEIAVRRNSSESYVTLAPREQIASSPYAVRTLSAASADNALQLGGIAASEYVTTSSVGNSFIRNGTTAQTGNFNISGNGIFGGGIGLGTSNLLSPLTIQNTNFTYGWTQTNGTVAISSYIDPTGGWLGTRSNHPLYFFTNSGLQQAALLQNGNFGVGTPLPLSKLDIRGNLTIENGTNPILFTGTGGVEQNRYLSIINSPSLQTASGLKAGGLLVSDSYNFADPGKNDLIVKGSVGIGTNNPLAKLQIAGTGANGFTLGVEGNATQNRDKGGFVKAMVYVGGTGIVQRCYNGLTGASLTGGTTNTGCGFSISLLSSGVYQVDFGFQVHDRFYSATPSAGVTSLGLNLYFNTFTTNQINVRTYNPEDNSATNGPFCIIIF